MTKEIIVILVNKNFKTIKGGFKRMTKHEQKDNWVRKIFFSEITTLTN